MGPGRAALSQDHHRSGVETIAVTNPRAPPASPLTLTAEGPVTRVQVSASGAQFTPGERHATIASFRAPEAIALSPLRASC